MRRSLFLGVFILLWTSLVAATDIYFDLATHGGNDGTSCADARAYSSHTRADDVAGNTLHLCGTGTASPGAQIFTTLAAGSSGSPITLKLEPGAILQAPYLSTSGAIVIQHAYWILDGGTNGIIQNTLNGNSGGSCVGGPCTSQQETNAVVLTAGGNNATIKNLSIINLFIRVMNSNDGGADGTQAIVNSASNVRITNNRLRNAYTEISAIGTNSVNVELDHNTLSVCNHCVTGALAGNGVTAGPVKVHDNDFAGGSTVYDQPDDAYHRNAILFFLDSASCTGNCSITGLQIYSNYFHGSWSASQMNSYIFLDDSGSTNHIQGVQIFNNVFSQDPGDGGFDCSYVVCQSQNSSDAGNIVVNNTVAPLLINNGTCVRLDQQVNLRMENNIFQTCGYSFNNHQPPFTSAVIDYNLWYMGSLGNQSNWFWQASCGSGCTFATWQAAGFDTHGAGNGHNPMLNADFTLQSGSSAIGNADNLTSLGIAALTVGAPQTFGVGGTCGTGCVARPSSGAWDAGAYPYASLTGQPAPPSNLVATPQ
jgi:hypothetical protein